MFTEEESVRAYIVGKLGRLRMYLYIILVLLYLAAYFLGYAVKPSPQFAAQVNEAISQQEALNNKLSASPVAAFSYRLTSLLVSLGPSLIPIFGIWSTAYQWAINGIATNAASSSIATSIMAETILLSFIIAIPSTEGLLLTLTLINYGRDRGFRDLVLISLREYILFTILAIVFLILLSALP